MPRYRFTAALELASLMLHRKRFAIRTIQWIPFMLCFVCVVPSSAELINHWKFDESSGLIASDSAGDLDLDIVLSDPFDTENKFVPGTDNNGLNFTGYLAGVAGFNPGSPFDMDQDFSIALWVNHHTVPEAAPGVTSPQRWISWGSGSGGRFFFGPNPTTGIVAFSVSTASTPTWADTTPVIGEWEHWALTRSISNETVSLYRNGELVETKTYAASGAINPEGGLQVGRGRTGLSNAEFLDGIMDDLAIWNEVLNPLQVKAAMDLGAENYNNFVIPSDTIWNADRSGDWNLNDNWDILIAPNGDDKNAIFGGAITAPRTVFTDQPVKVKSLTFDGNNTYAIAGVGSVTLDASSGDSSINVSQGSHQIQTALNLDNNAVIQVANGSTLDLNNRVNLNGNTLNISGQGTGAVNINHSLITGGGTLNNFGVLGTAGTTTIDGNLFSSGTLRIRLGDTEENAYDAFQVAGSAVLSGEIDVEIGADFLPGEAYTILTASTLESTGLTLHPSDTGSFNLLKSGTSLILQSIGAGLAGDFNGNGTVENADLTLLLNNWGKALPPTPAGWVGDQPTGDAIDNGELTALLNNWGSSGAGAATAEVPEPTSLMLLLSVLLPTLGFSRRFA